MNEGGLSPADIMAMTNNGDMNGNNAFFWIFALLLLGGLGNNGWAIIVLLMLLVMRILLLLMKFREVLIIRISLLMNGRFYLQ